MDIREFVAARIQDDEDYARQAAEGLGPDWIEIWSATVDLTANILERQPEKGHWGAHVDTPDSGVSRHMVRWDPARVLREVEAKRKLLAEIGSITMTRLDGEADPGELERPAGRMLRAIAAPYADHPDFDPAWRLGVL